MDDSDEFDDAMSDFKEGFITPGHPIAFSGLTKIYNHYKKIIPLRVIRKHLSSVDAYTEHRESKSPRVTNPTYAYFARHSFQADLCETQDLSEFNDGVRYIFTCVDIWSRKAFCAGMKDKTGKSAAAAFQIILDEAKTSPIYFFSDLGKEFLNTTFRALCDEKKIKMRNCFTSGHCSIVERFNRSLQNLIYKYCADKETHKFIDVLPALVDSYNNREHRFLGMSPNQAEDPANIMQVRDAHERHYMKVKTNKRLNKELLPDQLVRVAYLKTKFGRGYKQTQTDEIFRIDHVGKRYRVPLYFLKDYGGKNLIQGGFYASQLTPVTKTDFKVAKVLQTKGNKILVSWRGFPDSENSWIDKRQVTKKF